MIAVNVPILTSSWSGTGTVIVESAVRFCITMWLLRRRTSANPCRRRIAQTSAPDQTRSLPMNRLKPGYEHLAPLSAGHFRRVGAIQKQFDRLLQVGDCFLDRI